MQQRREWAAGILAVLTIIFTYAANDVLGYRFGWFGMRHSGGGSIVGLIWGLLLMLVAGVLFTMLVETPIREPAWLTITAGMAALVFAGHGRFWFCGPFAAVLLLLGLAEPGREVNRWWGFVSGCFSWLFFGYGMLMLAAILKVTDPVTWETGRISAVVFAVEPRWVMVVLMLFALLGGAALYSDAWHSRMAPLIGAVFLAAALFANVENAIAWRHADLTRWPELPLWGFGMVERFAASAPAVILGGVLAVPLLWKARVRASFW